MPAAMVDRLAGPGSQQDLQCLVEHLPPRSIIDLLLGLGELAGELVPAQTHTEDEAATAEPIQRRGFPGHLDRRRRGSGLTMGPSITSSVAAATAARVIHGSATRFIGSRQRS